MIFTADKVEYQSENDYYWYGKVKNETDGGCDGSIMLMAKEGRKFGTIILDDDSYEYQDISGGYQALSKVKTELFTEQECGVNSNTPIAKFEPPSNPTPTIILPCTGNNSSVRILVLWTQAAQNAEANINDRVNLAVAQTNQAYGNSGIGNVNVVLAGSQLLAGFTETTSMLDDVNNLVVFLAAQNLRALNQADLVVLLTNGTVGEYSTTFGRVQSIGPSFAGAYGIVQTNAATGGRFTFAHEVGHLFGARHNNDAIGTIEHGYLFWTRKWFLGAKTDRYTLLALLPAGATRELNYSNPNIQIQNKPTGTACCNNNAQMHNNTFPTIATFFAEPLPPFNADISTFQSTPSCFPQNAEAIIQCGTGPYTYLWETSFDGINYSFSGNQEILPIGGYCLQPGDPSVYVFYRLTVTDALGAVTGRIKSFLIYPTFYTSPAKTTNQLTTTEVSVVDKKAIIEEVFPNPAASNSRMLLNLPANGVVKVEIVDVLGNIKLSINKGTLVKGKNIIDLNLSVLANGIYRINLYYNDALETKQIIINK